MNRRHITLDPNQKSIGRAEFQRRSWMYEDTECTLGHLARHEIRLYKAASRKTIKRISETSSIDDAPSTCEKIEKKLQRSATEVLRS